jgi:hypothetical protein
LGVGGQVFGKGEFIVDFSLETEHKTQFFLDNIGY